MSLRFWSLPPALQRHGVSWLRLWLILVVASVAGCKKDQPRHQPGVMVVVPTQSATWIRNFNPLLPSQALWPAEAGIYEPLIIYNRITQKYVPWLAESFRWNEDATELTFTIRDGVKWSDGRPFSSEDVWFTWDLVRRHRALDQAGMWQKLEKVEAKGRDVIFHFREPFIVAAFFVGERPIVPQHVWKDVEDPVKFRNETPVGTGPFTEVNAFKTQVYELGKNPHYWQDGRPYLDAIRVPAFPGNEQASLALIRGEIDWAALFIPAIDRIFVKKDPEHHGYHFPQVEGTVMLYPNHSRPPLGDVRVRKALSHALDRQRIVRIALQGYTEPADATALSDLYKRYKNPQVLEEEGDWTRHDPELAGRMLDEVGIRRGSDGMRRLADGRPFHVDVDVVVGWSDWIIAAQIIIRNLQQLGVSATLRTYEHGTWFHRLQTGDFDLSIAWSSGGPTPYTYYQRQMSTRTKKPIGYSAEHNWQRFGSKEADELLTRFAKTSDPRKQYELATELQRLFVRHAPALPLFPGPAWGQYNSERIVGFPTKDDPYAPLAPYKAPGNLLSLVRLKPRFATSRGAAD